MFKIAFRNVLRNGRRSIMTASAVAVGAAALVLFAGYFGMVELGMNTGVVQSMGHLSVFKKGYSDFGSARPLEYSISGYEKVIETIKSDPVLKPMLVMVTPTVTLYGIAGNSTVDKSKTFFGVGVVPADQDKMYRWDQYDLYGGGNFHTSGLSGDKPDHGVMGRGIARILGLCKPLNLGNCPDQEIKTDNPLVLPVGAAKTGAPRIDLLASAGGAPNIVAFYVDEAVGMGAKEMDESYIKMNLPLAQRLLYGAGEPRVSAIVIQVKRMEDVGPARARLEALFKEKNLDLEVRDFKQLMPIVQQTLGFFYVMFAFLAVVLGVIVLFTIANTMSMSVMERTNEIGTARAMGVRRNGIRRLFLLEGAILGAIGATVGLILAAGLSYWINHAGITYTPPGNATPVPLSILTSGTERLQAIVWGVLVVISTIASLIPANRAARMQVVDALRHV